MGSGNPSQIQERGCKEGWGEGREGNIGEFGFKKLTTILREVFL